MTTQPTDDQVVLAIQQRRQFFMDHYQTDDINDTHESWAFNHIMTVLDHCEKIFKTDTQQLIDDIKPTHRT